MTPTLHVHIQRAPDKHAMAYFQSIIDPCVEITVADDTSRDDQVTVLVSGRPTLEEITRFPQLEKVIIPWAGVPQETLEVLKDKPTIQIHKLHHNAVPVAEYTLMLMLAAAKNIIPMDRALRQFDWRPRYAPGTALLLTGKTALILGYGHIGRVLAKYLKSFDMNVLATRYSVKSPQKEDGVEVYPANALRSLLPNIDYLIIALPHTPETDGQIGEQELNLLSPSCILVNIGRGAVIDQGALFHALKTKRIAGAGIDVWYNYPKNEESRMNTPPADYPFHELDNIVLSPHRAGGLNTDDTERLRVSHLAVLLNAQARGEEMPNRVDRQKGY